MIYEHKSLLTGKINQMNIDVSPEQVHLWIVSKQPIQKQLPWLSPDEREFLMTGITPEEWNELDLEE